MSKKIMFRSRKKKEGSEETVRVDARHVAVRPGTDIGSDLLFDDDTPVGRVEHAGRRLETIPHPAPGPDSPVHNKLLSVQDTAGAADPGNAFGSGASPVFAAGESAMAQAILEASRDEGLPGQDADTGDAGSLGSGLSGQDAGTGTAGSLGSGIPGQDADTGDAGSPGSGLPGQDAGTGDAGSLGSGIPGQDAGTGDAGSNELDLTDDGERDDPIVEKSLPEAISSHSPSPRRSGGAKKGLLKPGRTDRRSGPAGTIPVSARKTGDGLLEDDGPGSLTGSSVPRFSLLEDGPGSSAAVSGSGLLEDDGPVLSATTAPGPGRQQQYSPTTIPGTDLLEEDTASPSGGTAAHHGLFARLRRKNGSSNGSSATGEAPKNGKKAGKLPALFSKQIRSGLSSIHFDPGPLSEPSLEGNLKDVNVTYPVDPPFQYVHIEFDDDEGSMLYQVLEPELSEDELFAVSVVEQGFEKMISTNLDLIAGGDRAAYLKEKFLSLLKIFGISATDGQVERMFFHLKKKYLGYSHMDTLMKDKYIEDISCNGSDIYLYVMHRIYGSVQTDVKFAEVELNNFVLKLAQIGGRHISLLQPIRDVTLPDGSRANLTLGGEVTKKGSTFTIRKFRSSPISPIEMMEYGTIDAPQLAYLWILMENKRSILVSGGTATGKTTMLNVLCAFIPNEYKIVSIEDTAELNLMSPNWIQSVTRTGFGASEGPSGASGVSGISRRSPGDISLYDLLVAALRQRPEFIIVGEVRGDEAFTLFQAIAVGHAALGTIHAGSINELMARIDRADPTGRWGPTGRLECVVIPSTPPSRVDRSASVLPRPRIPAGLPAGSCAAHAL